MTPAGFPHSDILGSQPACGYPRLFAARCVLLRHLVPRHPPCALNSLTLPFLRSLATTIYARGRLHCYHCVVVKVLAALTRAAKSSLVEMSGFEPLTYCVQSSRSPD